ncbi:hypothetical protein D9M68_749830 [compost metagenome]
MHLFGENASEIEEEYLNEEQPKANNDLAERLTKVEEELVALKANFDKLMKELMG